VLFEGKTGIAGEAFGVGTQRLQEALNLSSNLLVARQVILSRAILFCPNQTPFGVHFTPPLPSEPGQAHSWRRWGARRICLS
jgi:hypothetical protein